MGKIFIAILCLLLVTMIGLLVYRFNNPPQANGPFHNLITTRGKPITRQVSKGPAMNLQLIRELITKPTDKSIIDRIWDDDGTLFWVDHGEQDEDIVKNCESHLKTGKLSAEFDDKALTLYIQYGDKREMVPLTNSPADRHITLVALNKILTPDYETRLLNASIGGDTLAFVPLPCSEWQALDREFGADRVTVAFRKLESSPNVFTDTLIVPPPIKPWWKIW